MNEPQGSEEILHCTHCGEVIGVYEPMIACVDGAPVYTSRAALSRDGSAVEGACVHADCDTRRELG